MPSKVGSMQLFIVQKRSPFGRLQRVIHTYVLCVIMNVAIDIFAFADAT